MTRFAIAAAVVSLVACGGSQSPRKNAAVFALSLPANRQFEVESRATTVLILVALGSEGPVQFSMEEAPAFATLLGDRLTLAPTVNDLGSYPVTVNATDGVHSDSKTLTILVQGAKNTAPVFNGIQYISDSISSQPGSGWTGCMGTPWIEVRGAHDEDGDALRLEAEVVKEDVAFSGSANYVSALQKPNGGPTGKDTAFRLELPGLVLGQPYRVADRIVDEWGAASPWAHPSPRMTGASLVCTPFAIKAPGIVAWVGSTVTQEITVVGSLDPPVTLTAEKLPSFATFDGLQLTATPTAADRGQWFGIAFVATDGAYVVRQDSFITQLAPPPRHDQ
jgi:hypothetical protein